MDSIPVGDSDFFFVPHSGQTEYFIFLTNHRMWIFISENYQAQNLPFLLKLSHTCELIIHIVHHCTWLFCLLVKHKCYIMSPPSTFKNVICHFFITVKHHWYLITNWENFDQNWTALLEISFCALLLVFRGQTLFCKEVPGFLLTNLSTVAHA